MKQSWKIKTSNSNLVDQKAQEKRDKIEQTAIKGPIFIYRKNTLYKVIGVFPNHN